MKTLKFLRSLAIALMFVVRIHAQSTSIAVLNMDVLGLEYSAEAMGNLLRLEVEKTGKHNVLDKYDITYVLEKESFKMQNCYGKICLVEAGKLLKSDKVLSGSIERFDDKIVLVLRLIDVKSESIEKIDVMEYIDLPEIQRMVEVSLNNIFSIENDPNIVNQLVNYNDPIHTPKTQLTLNGPRMGFSYIGGKNGAILQSPKSEGGFDMIPYSTLIGYQHEISYLSSGSFQALFEIIALFGGLEQGRFVPSITLMNGFRSNRTGIEIAFGPVFEVVTTASGYYDDNNDWHLESDWYTDENNSYYEENNLGNMEYFEVPNPYELVDRLDSRGSPIASTAWVWAIGKTFRSGYLNIPVNAYFSAKKNGWVVGCSFGFNISQR